MNRDMIRPPMVFIGPPGYSGNCWIVDCKTCRGVGTYTLRVNKWRVEAHHACETCNGMGVVAVPRREKKQ